MKLEKPFIFLFETPNGHYIYDVNTNAILETDISTYNVLQEMATGADTSSGLETLAEDDECYGVNRMLKDGFLSANRIKEVVHPSTVLLPTILENKISKITLQVTQQCNLRCNYCTYSGTYLNRKHSKKIMKFETARKGIDFIINHSIDCERINIGFYGGEPLLEFKLIQACILYAEEVAEGKELTFNITTNGTLLNDRIIQFFQEHDVGLMISLDGPKEVHDRNRRFAVKDEGTFDKIFENIKKIKAKYPDYFNKITFNAVMDPSNDDFKCSSQFFSGDDVIKDSFINPSTINSQYKEEEINLSDNFRERWGYEIFKLFLFKLNRLDERYVSKLVSAYFDRIRINLHEGRNLSSKMPDKVHHGGPCIPGAQRLFMNVHGDFFPCERVSELSEVMNIGNVDKGFYLQKVEDLLNIGKITEDHCKECWAFRFCGLCAAAADNLTALSREQKLQQCANVRRTVEEMMKDYCTLVEFGYHFDDTDKPVLSYL
ncbi:Cys-rich peptide radical SAM maturase CcpM [Paenibacillus macerans]|uniref:Cys-rich peptide radical SAM maturase CcpM n=1 Tax=Paenibacillus macerans TaxID=44252 RepID=A0A6N8EVL5_PAEMA|nr:Cys-rich peptide radical SAM maturase CcpM [Paenibacillus macerans]MUG23705.1 Cys-rich peptide radical SAM maturase CcpM [Paenibacillus macerans]